MILIVTDDQRWDRIDEMPELQDRIVDRGIQFDNAFVTSPLCNPSRASILTGRYARHLGLLLPSGKVGAAPEFHQNGHPDSTIATWLHARGYTTGLFGKYMNAYWRVPQEPPPGWDEWHAFLEGQELYYDYTLNENGRHRAFGSDPEDYSTDVLADKVVDFIDANAERPFFVYFAPFAPHWTARPAPRHVDALADREPARAVAYKEPDISDKPAIVKLLSLIWQLGDDPTTDADVDFVNQRRAESLLAVDDAIARIDDALEARDIARDTVIIFTSDNGVGEGEHWLDGKNLPYEEMLRVPLVVRPGRGIWPPRNVEHTALNIDLAPTIAALAGAEATTEVDGLDIFDAPPRRRTFMAETGRLFLVPGWSSIRTPRWKYTRYRTGESELYDLRRDPFELENAIVTQPGARVDRLVARLGEQLDALERGEPLGSAAGWRGERGPARRNYNRRR